MDSAALVNALAASISGDPVARKSSEEYLVSVKSADGFIVGLLGICLSEHPLELRQLAVIFLKNATRPWKDELRGHFLSAGGKEYLRANILNCLRFSVPEKIRSQFEEIAYSIVVSDYPWDSVFIQIECELSSGDVDRIYSGLALIYQVARMYEYALSKKRENLRTLVDSFFGALETFFTTLLTELLTEDNKTVYFYIEIILKIYWVSTYIEIPASQMVPEVLDSWIGKFQQILDLPMGGLAAPAASEEDSRARAALPQWSCKRWAIQILHRFFNRYFNLCYLKDPSKQVGQHFQQYWADRVFSSVLPQLLSRSTQFLPDLFANYLLKYASQAVKFASTFEMIKPVSVQLITDVIIPFLSRVPSEEEIWIENPIEFIRKEADLARAFYTPKSSALDLLISLCEKGQLPAFLIYISQQLQSSISLIQKEALLLAVGSVALLIREDEGFAGEMQNLLLNHVLPECGSSVGFLRARSCWLYGQFAAFPFTSAEHQSLALQKICSLTVDPELPVRYKAATALPHFLIWEGSKETIGAEIKALLNVYLAIMEEIDSEDLMDALEEVIARFDREIVPYALDLAERLKVAFLRMAQEDLTANEGESAMAAVSTLNTIGKLVDSLEERPEDLFSISLLLMPVFEYSFSRLGCEYFEEALHVLACLLYYAPNESLPHLFPLVFYLKIGIVGAENEEPYAGEHLEEAFSSLGNFIGKYQTLALQHIELFFTLVSELLAAELQEAILGCKLAICLFENLKGRVNSVVIGVAGAVAQLLASSGSKSIQQVCFQVLCVALWYDPVLTLEALSHSGQLSGFFSYCFTVLNSIKKNLAKAYAFYGLASLVGALDSLPEQVKAQGHYIMAAALQLGKSIKQEDSFTDKKYGEFYAEASKVSPEYQRLIEKIRLGKLKDSCEEDEFQVGSDSDDLYDSPFECKDDEEYLKQALGGLQKRDPAVYSVLLASVQEEHRDYLASVLSN